MKKIGEVKLILDSHLAIVMSKEELLENERIIVFARITHEKLHALGLDDGIVYPKGQLRVICAQGKDIFLVERFREMQEKIRREPNPFAKHFLLKYSLNDTREVVQEIPGPWSAELDDQQMLDLEIPRAVVAGDAIGKLS